MSYDLDNNKRYKIWQAAQTNIATLTTAEIAYNKQTVQVELTVPQTGAFKQLRTVNSEWLPLVAFGSPVSDTDETILAHKIEFTVTLKVLSSIVPFIRLDLLYKLKDNPNIFDNTNIKYYKFIQSISAINKNTDIAEIKWYVGFVNTLQQTPDPIIPKGCYEDPVTGKFKSKITNQEVEATEENAQAYPAWQDYEMKLLFAVRNPNYYTSA